MERRFYDLGRINYWGAGKADWQFDETRVSSREELVRMRTKREIQHVHGAPMVEAVPMVSVAGHELPADEFIARYKFRLEPATDDRPYFFLFFKWRVLPEVLALRERGGASLIEWGYPVLIATLVQAAIAGALLILLPLLRVERSWVPGTGPRMGGYFFLLGLAFLFIEIAFIQNFILFGLGAVLIVANIWLPDTWGLTRGMGVALVTLAAFAVTVPVFHGLDRGVVARSAVTDDAIRYCPHCGGKLSGEIGVELECSRCGRGFSVVPYFPT